MNNSNVCILSNKNIEAIVEKRLNHKLFQILNVHLKTSQLMLGFLGDYHYLTVDVKDRESNKDLKLKYFIKSVSRDNAGKAEMVTSLKLCDKEVFFYSTLKKLIHIPEFRAWSGEFYGFYGRDLVLEDLKASGFMTRNNLMTMDVSHCKQALLSLASLHASSLIYEETQRRSIDPNWTIQDNYEKYLDNGGYVTANLWTEQCMLGALQGLKSLPKYAKATLEFDNQWRQVWPDAFRSANNCNTSRNVLCHRDLWSNNIMFHYNEAGEPDECVFVDFQAIRCQPPAGDVILTLYLNLDKKTREDNFDDFISFYYREVQRLVEIKGFNLRDMIPKKDFLASIEEQRKWGLVIAACLLPQMWMDEELIKRMFSDSEKFNDILLKNKGDFITQMMKEDQRYKTKVVECFEEIVDRYINQSDVICG